MIDQQLHELYERPDREQNVDIARKIGALFEQKAGNDNLTNAIWWYEKAGEIVKHTDPGIERKVSDLRMKVVEQHIADNEQWLASYPDADAASQVREHLVKT